MAKFKVAIDAGHGSNTAGKRTPKFEKNYSENNKILVKKGEEFREHYANTMVCVFLEKELKKYDIDIVKTGWNDSDVYDDEDTALSIRQSIIKKNKCDISVSVHFNACGNGDWHSAEGVETHVHSSDAKRGDSMKLAKLVQGYLAKGTEQKDRGIWKTSLAMCNTYAMGTKASILVELGFMTSKRESKLMASTAFQKECAQEICQGIVEYLVVKKDSKTTVASEEKADKKEAKLATAKSYSKAYSKEYKVKAQDGLNMRTSPSVLGSLITTIPYGKYARCYGYYTGKWYLVTYNGHTGYVNSSYLVK